MNEYNKKINRNYEKELIEYAENYSVKNLWKKLKMVKSEEFQNSPDFI
jgi:hypothetical protein